MILWDGSRHDWLEGRGPMLCLMGAIDDATGELLPGAHFVEQECGAGYLRVLLAIAKEKGLPCSAYMDQHGSLKRNDDNWTLEEELRGEQDPTMASAGPLSSATEPTYARHARTCPTSGGIVPITQNELEVILADETKHIDGDLRWKRDEDHSPAVEFRIDVASAAGYPLLVIGRFNALADTLSYTLVHRGTGRVYGLDLGADHHNPTCVHVGEKHKHRWTDQYADKEAYVPADVTETAADPVAVWQQFCVEARIIHHGVLQTPPATEPELGL